MGKLRLEVTQLVRREGIPTQESVILTTPWTPAPTCANKIPEWVDPYLSTGYFSVRIMLSAWILPHLFHSYYS